MPREDLTPETIEQLRRFTFSAIHDLSNRDKQRRLWRNPTRPWHNASETVEAFWDNDYDWSCKFDFLAPEELRLIDPLIAALETYKPPTDWSDVDAILNDPEWTVVVEAAIHAVQRLAQLVDDVEERRHLLEGARVVKLPGGGERLE